MGGVVSSCFCGWDVDDDDADAFSTSPRQSDNAVAMKVVVGVGGTVVHVDRVIGILFPFPLLSSSVLSLVIIILIASTPIEAILCLRGRARLALAVIVAATAPPVLILLGERYLSFVVLLGRAAATVSSLMISFRLPPLMLLLLLLAIKKP